MKRRDFLKASVAACAVPFWLRPKHIARPTLMLAGDPQPKLAKFNDPLARFHFQGYYSMAVDKQMTEWHDRYPLSQEIDAIEHILGKAWIEYRLPRNTLGATLPKGCDRITSCLQQRDWFDEKRKPEAIRWQAAWDIIHSLTEMGDLWATIPGPKCYMGPSIYVRREAYSFEHFLWVRVFSQDAGNLIVRDCGPRQTICGALPLEDADLHELLHVWEES
jgi:hypothetical protein